MADPPPVDMQALLDELRHLRRMQGEILQLQAQILSALKAAPAPAPVAAAPTLSLPVEAPAPDPAPAATAPTVPRVRARRKAVLLVDDDAEARRAAVAALDQALVPVRQAADGMSALEALSTQKPDVLVLELGLGEPMRGRDLLKMVKSTKEWLDIPIVLYTRQSLGNARDAQAIHGADELVLKGTGAEEALVNRVIHIFQRGQ